MKIPPQNPTLLAIKGLLLTALLVGSVNYANAKPTTLIGIENGVPKAPKSATANSVPVAMKKRQCLLTIHPNIVEMPNRQHGPFVRLFDGAILVCGGRSASITRDDGKTWKAHPLFKEPKKFCLKSDYVLLRLKSGTILLVFNNRVGEKWSGGWGWNRKTQTRPTYASWYRPTYVIRSLDEGKTWTAPQKLLDGYCGALRDGMQTRNGSVIIMGQELLYDKGRHSSRAYVSKDDGQTWTKAEHLDRDDEPAHDHGGMIEATLEQLKDGRLWVLLRSSHGCFYESFSSDDGLTWTMPPKRSKIRSGHAPGMLRRLHSGRLVLVWNVTPGGYTNPRRRQEISIAFSDDDGKTWTRPVVIAKNPGHVSYPHVFEYEPGILWITTWAGKFCGIVKEKDFYEEAKNDQPLPPFYKSRDFEE